MVERFADRKDFEEIAGFLNSFFLKSSRVNFEIRMKATTDYQQFPGNEISHFLDVLRWQEMGKAAANLNGHETGNGRYSQGNT